MPSTFEGYSKTREANESGAGASPAPLAQASFVAAVLMAFAALAAGCVGSPIHSTIRYNNIQDDMYRNNHNLIALEIGMDKQQVAELMGEPERSEGYDWGSAWLYRTAMTSGIYGTSDTDFTPVVFDENGLLIGWGRNFFTEHVRRYEIRIKDN